MGPPLTPIAAWGALMLLSWRLVGAEITDWFRTDAHGTVRDGGRPRRFTQGPPCWASLEAAMDQTRMRAALPPKQFSHMFWLCCDEGFRASEE
jgi:hypothetical protein